MGVINCDTTDVLNSHHVERICLNGIDCPLKKVRRKACKRNKPLRIGLQEGSHASAIRQGQLRAYPY